MYLINRIVCMCNGVRYAYNVALHTEDLEKIRCELVNTYKCERIMFEYTEMKKDIIN